jgi:nitroreductase
LRRASLAAPELSLLYHAPVLIIVGTRSLGKQADEDCCLAALALMLRARNMGIGTCWIGSVRPWFNLAATKPELGIPGEASVVAPVVLGYPVDWPDAHGRNPATIHWVVEKERAASKM